MGLSAVRTRLEVMKLILEEDHRLPIRDPYSFGNVSPRWPWYLPFLSA